MREYTMSEEDKAMMDEAYNEMMELELTIYQKDQRLLKAIGSVMGAEYLKELNEFIEDCGDTSQYSIVSKPVSDYQLEDEYPLIKGCWVDQWCNGGYVGDNFAGDIYIKLPNKKLRERYLKIPYSC